MYKISLVDKPAIEENFIYFNEVNKIEMFSNDEKKEVVGPIMIPNKEILVHNLGTALMKSRTHQANLPFWMTAGMGYYAEHMVFDRCSIYYLDFEAILF